MKVRVLGSSGAEFPNMHPPAFLLDENVLLDAGTIGAVLTEEEQWNIRDIFLTHAHLDHIRGIPFLADNIILKSLGHTTNIMSTEPILKSLKDNLLNDMIWPDFTRIPNTENPVLTLKPIELHKPIKVNGYSITPVPVNHSVPAVGYVVESPKGRRFIYTGDTGPTEEIWQHTNPRVHCLIIEVSMPNSMEQMAKMTGHLTASLLGAELKKMKTLPEAIWITHPKPQYLGTIRTEIAALGYDNIQMLADGMVLTV